MSGSFQPPGPKLLLFNHVHQLISYLRAPGTDPCCQRRSQWCPGHCPSYPEHHCGSSRGCSVVWWLCSWEWYHGDPGQVYHEIVWKTSHSHLVQWPLTLIHHVSTSLCQRCSKLREPCVHAGRVGVAAVHLDIVNPPVREGLRISLEILWSGAGVASTGVSTIVSVDTKLETQLVTVVHQILDTWGQWSLLRMSD